MLDITNYMKAGFGALFVNTTEIKRAVRSIKINSNFNKVYWDSITGLYNNPNDPDNGAKPDIGAFEVIDVAAKSDLEKTAFILENYDNQMKNTEDDIIQKILNSYQFLKSKQNSIIIVGTQPKVIPATLREFIPVLEFNLPDKSEIENIANEVSETASKAAEEMFKEGKFTEEEYKSMNYAITDELIETCKGMTYEEIENILSFSAITKKCFDIFTILNHKKNLIKSTGFMNFMEIEPIENLCGLEYFKNYMIKRIEPFKNPKSIKPKIKAVLLVGVQGCGKSLAGKVLCSLFGWPGLIADMSALKGGILGETEANTRLLTRTIDAFGKSITVIDEIEKAFAGTGTGMAHETSYSQLGHLLTWMQDRKSEGILLATSNDLKKLPPELLRAGRWDTIFFVNLPNPFEIKAIIQSKNKIWQSDLPFDDAFCERLWEEKWSGAEIEQLAKDIHYEESLVYAMKQIPILGQYREKEVNKLISDCQYFRKANEEYISSTPKKLSLGEIKRKLTIEKEDNNPNKKLN